MNYLEKNLQVLGEFRPNLVEAVRNYAATEGNHSTNGKILIEIGKTGVRTAKWDENGKTQYIHSSYDPSKEAQNWVRRIKDDFRKYKTAIIIGFGLGYHLEEYIEHVSEEVRTLVFEPKMEIFYNALCSRDLTRLFKDTNFHFSVEEPEKTIVGRIGGLSFFDLTESPLLKIFPSYDRIFPEYCTYIEKELRENIGNKILNINTILFFSNLWPTNFFNNLPDILDNPGLISLFGKFKDKPAIIVSAGPSLTKNVDLLKSVKGKALIICVDTALRVLLARGIMPDLTVVVDGSDLNYKHFEGIDPTPVPLVFNSIANSDMVKLHKGRKLSVNMGVSLMDWVEKAADLEFGRLDQTGPSVANIALQIAKKIEANPIILIGQDLAYTNGSSHASGTALCKPDVIKSKSPINLLKIKDIYGNDVYTDRGFYAMLKSFELAIEHMDTRVIDATEGGARIEGTEILTLQEAIEWYCQDSFDVTGIIDSVFESFPGLTDEKRNRLRDAFSDVAKRLKKVKTFSQKGVKMAEELFKFAGKGRLNEPRVGKLLKKMDGIDEIIKKEQDTFTFVQLIIQPVMLQVLKGPLAEEKENEPEKERGQRIALKSKILYQGLVEVCEYMLELVENAVKDLEAKNEF